MPGGCTVQIRGTKGDLRGEALNLRLSGTAETCAAGVYNSLSR